MQKTIAFLLENAGPSITSRVKNEVLGQKISADLQEKILKEQEIQNILLNCQSDGWIGSCFHTRMNGAKPFDVSEVALRYLAEKGIDLSNSIFTNAAKSYISRDISDPIFEGSDKFGHTYTCIGGWLVRTSGLVRIGQEHICDLSADIDLSYNSFLNVLNYSSLEEILLQNAGGQYYFKDSVLWPCFYHLKILAFSEQWRSEETIRNLARAADYLMTIGKPDLRVYTKMKHYYASPCDAFVYPPVSNFNVNNVTGAWFDKMELFARCGIIKYSSILKSEVEALKSSINDNGICLAHADGNYFNHWSAYSGLRLEESWRSAIRKRCDISFRALMILFYSQTL